MKMCKISDLFKSLNKTLKQIRLVDKCLIIFMILLMGQTVYNLFINESISLNSNMLDVVVRTTSASIFGYFISSNFLSRNQTKANDCNKQINYSSPENSYSSFNNLKLDSNKNVLQNIDEMSTDQTYLELYEENKKLKEINNQQIIIVTIIGVISLIVLIIVRNSNYSTTYSLGSLSQLRDFVSGCVGFLLGYPIKKN